MCVCKIDFRFDFNILTRDNNQQDLTYITCLQRTTDVICLPTKNNEQIETVCLCVRACVGEVEKQNCSSNNNNNKNKCVLRNNKFVNRLGFRDSKTNEKQLNKNT